MLGVLGGYEIYNMITWYWCLRNVSQYAQRSKNTLLIFDSSFRITKVVNYDIEISGYMPEELIEVSLWNVFSPPVVRLFLEGYKQASLYNITEDVKFASFENEKAKGYMAKFIPMRNNHIACLIQEIPVYQINNIFQKEENYGEVVNVNLTPTYFRNVF